jgi:hypothetical protein
MILATSGIIASQIASFDADAVAFFNRVTTAGGTLSNTEKQAVNTLVVALKANSLWTPMKAIYPMVGASAAACAQNLKSSSFTGTFTSGWTFASTGVTPNGTSAYMDTSLIPNSVLSSVNSTHLSYYSRTNNAGTTVRAEMGCVNNIGTFLPLLQLIIYGKEGLINDQFLAQAYDYTPGTQIQVNGTNSLGFFAMSRTAINLLRAYKNNSTISSATTNQTQTTMPTNNLYLGAWNQNGTAAKFSNRQCAFASIGDGLTDTQASNFYTAVQAFQTTLSRNV